MKTNRSLVLLRKTSLLCLAAALAAAMTSPAATILKLDDSLLLTNPVAWSGGAVPGSGDIAQFDGNGGTYYSKTSYWSPGGPLDWGGIQVLSPTNVLSIIDDGNTLTLESSGVDLSAATVNFTLRPAITLNAAQTWTVNASRNLYDYGPIGDGGNGYGITKAGTGTLYFYGTNNYAGQTIVNAGTLTVQTNAISGAGSTVVVNNPAGGSGGTFGNFIVNAGGVVNGPVLVKTNSAGSSINCTVNGTIAGNVTTDAGSGPASPNANATPLVGTGFVNVNGGGSLAASGYITNNGQVKFSGTTPVTFGTFIMNNGLGGIWDANQTAKTFTFPNGSQLSYFQCASNQQATLQVAGNGSASIRFFGYADANSANPAAWYFYTNTLNGGTWTIGNIGQNNSSCHYVGTCIVSNSASVTVTNNIGFSHGSWIVVSNSSLTFNQSGRSLAPGHAASDIGLSLSVSNSGTLYVGGNGLSLGYQGGNGYNTTNEYNSLTVGDGGAAYVTNAFNIGSGQADNQAGETNTLDLAGGKLLVTGTLAPGSGANGQSVTTPWNPVPPVNVFNWSGGLLAAGTITVSNGLVIQIVTNTSGVGYYVTNPAVCSMGNMSSTALTNSGGIMAPGDDEFPGRTVINGGYVQTDGGTISMDLGGTTRASSFQAPSTNGYYDYLQANGPIQLGGSLKIKLVGGYAPAYTDQLNIIASSGTGNFITGTFTNLIAGPGLGRVPVDGMTNTYFTVIVNSQTNTLYLINYTNISSVAAPVASFSGTPVGGVRPLVVNFTNSSTGSFTNGLWSFGDGNTTNTADLLVPHTYTAAGTYDVSLTVQGAGGDNAVTNTGYVNVALPQSPALSRINATATSVTLQGTNGPVSASQTYYYWLLETTNLTTPVWSSIATNPFNADGSFSNSIPVTPGVPIQFYKMQMP